MKKEDIRLGMPVEIGRYYKKVKDLSTDDLPPEEWGRLSVKGIRYYEILSKPIAGFVVGFRNIHYRGKTEWESDHYLFEPIETRQVALVAINMQQMVYCEIDWLREPDQRM